MMAKCCNQAAAKAGRLAFGLRMVMSGSVVMTINVLMELLDTKNNGKDFFLNLRILLFCLRESA